MKPSSSEFPTSLQSAVSQKCPSLERRSALHIATKVQNLFADGRAENVGRNLLSDIITRDRKDQVSLLCSTGNTKDRAGNKRAVRLRKALTFELSSGGRVGLR